MEYMSQTKKRAICYSAWSYGRRRKVASFRRQRGRKRSGRGAEGKSLHIPYLWLERSIQWWKTSCRCKSVLARSVSFNTEKFHRNTKLYRWKCRIKRVDEDQITTASFQIAKFSCYTSRLTQHDRSSLETKPFITKKSSSYQRAKWNLH